MSGSLKTLLGCVLSLLALVTNTSCDRTLDRRLNHHHWFQCEVVVHLEKKVFGGIIVWFCGFLLFSEPIFDSPRT